MKKIDVKHQLLNFNEPIKQDLYEIDFEKVTNIEDVINVLKLLQIVFSQGDDGKYLKKKEE